MDYFNEEEEFELRYEDDLDALNEMDSVEYDLIKGNQDGEVEKIAVRSDEREKAVLHLACDDDGYISTKGPKRPLSCEVEPDSDLHDDLIKGNQDREVEKIAVRSDEREKAVLHLACDDDGYISTKGSKRPLSCEVEPDSDLHEYKKFKSMENHSELTTVGNASFSSTVNLPPALEFDILPLTKSNGSKAYFHVYESQSEMPIFSFSRNVSSLLNAPISVLKSEANSLLEKIQDSSALDTLPCLTENHDVSWKEDELWVEKYRPQTYKDLLSEEGINRTLLHWLKLWDKPVFGKETAKPKKTQKNSTEQQQSQQKLKFKKFLKLDEEPDEHGRPHHKVAFLCGPPGLGKTTLANIIANHAGYNVVELNASDDRSPDVFRVSLEAATQMKAVLDKDRRPNCLVIDEIDGSPAPSINVLLSFIKSSGAVQGKRRKGDVPILMRPIICICNDQYTPALKPLRQLALVLNFPSISTKRLTSRLHEIILQQHVKADANAVTLLCEKADNDVRSCLSTLQFIYKKKKELLICDVHGTDIGLKDTQKTLFAVWLEVFYISRKKMRLPKLLNNLECEEISKSNDSSLKFRFNKVLHSVQTSSEYEKLLSGLFENYLKVKFKDTYLDAIWRGPEWLCFADVIQQEISQSQLYTLMTYLPYCGVAFHLLYGCSTYPQISYPSSSYECHVKRTQFLNILASVISDITASVKNFFNATSLVLDFLPALVEIIKPTLRPVSIQLYSDREKAELNQIIKLMIAFNLTYRQECSAEGQYSYILEPSIEELVHFPGLKARQGLTYAMKQLITREVELEKMRRYESSNSVTTHLPKSRMEKSKNSSMLDLGYKTKQVSTEKTNLDFFGRKIGENFDSIKNDYILYKWYQE